MALSDGDKVSLTRTLCGVEEGAHDALLTSYLALARGRILALRNPFSADPDAEAWEPRYDTLQCEFAADMYNRRGAEGETSHTEGGITRKWGTDSVSRGLVQRVVPKGRAV